MKFNMQRATFNSDLEVCPVKTHDFRQLSALYSHSIKCNPKGFIQDLSFHGPVRDMCQKFQGAGGDMLVGKLDTKLVAMGALRKVNERRCELCKLHVDPNCQGFGFGKCLTLELLERAKQLSFKEVELHVTKTQTAAIGLYTKLGFNKVDQKVCEIEVSGNQLSYDTIFMEKEIGSQ